MVPVKTSTILYMEDDRDDVELLTDVLHLIDPAFQLLHAPNGEEGLKMLQRLQTENALPCLVVIDLNMPKLSGRETFDRLKAEDMLSKLPVVIFSTSDSPSDKAYFKGEQVAYMTKPLEFDLLLQAAKRLLGFCQN